MWRGCRGLVWWTGYRYIRVSAVCDNIPLPDSCKFDRLPNSTPTWSRLVLQGVAARCVSVQDRNREAVVVINGFCFLSAGEGGAATAQCELC